MKCSTARVYARGAAGRDGVHCPWRRQRLRRLPPPSSTGAGRRRAREPDRARGGGCCGGGGGGGLAVPLLSPSRSPSRSSRRRLAFLAFFAFFSAFVAAADSDSAEVDSAEVVEVEAEAEDPAEDPAEERGSPATAAELEEHHQPAPAKRPTRQRGRWQEGGGSEREQSRHGGVLKGGRERGSWDW